MSGNWLNLEPEAVKRLLAEKLDPVDAPEEMDLTRAVRDPLDYEPDYIASLNEAAVLVPIFDRPDGLTVLLTQRTADMPSHASQISFPGGRRHPEDSGPVATALREAHEEVGLEPERVRILGKVSTIVIATGFRVTPIVGLVDPVGFKPRLSVREVAEAFEVPFEHLLNPANYEEHEREFGGRSRRFHAVPYGEKFVWGATAGMLWTLQQRLNEKLHE